MSTEDKLKNETPLFLLIFSKLETILKINEKYFEKSLQLYKADLKKKVDNLFVC